MRYIYPAFFTENELGGVSVDFPDFECCATDGDTFEEAAYMAAEALELAIEATIETGKKLPEPSYELAQTNSSALLICADVDTSKLMVPSKDAARMLNVSAARVRQMLISGQLAGEKRGRDNYIYLWSIRERARLKPHAGRPRKEALA